MCLVNYSFRVTWKNDVFSSFFKILVAKTPKHENSMWENPMVGGVPKHHKTLGSCCVWGLKTCGEHFGG